MPYQIQSINHNQDHIAEIISKSISFFGFILKVRNFGTGCQLRYIIAEETQ